MEFDDTGSLVSCDFKCYSIISYDEPFSVSYTADNGRVTCNAYFDFVSLYEIRYSDSYEKEELKIRDTGNSYLRTDGQNGTGILGKWESVDGLGLGFMFWEDGTGMYNNKFPITWNNYTDENGNEVLHYILQDTTYFDYKISGDMLTVFLSDNSRVYTKVSN